MFFSNITNLLAMTALNNGTKLVWNEFGLMYSRQFKIYIKYNIYYHR